MKYESLIAVGLIVVLISDNPWLQVVGTLIIGIPVLIKLREEYNNE